MRKIGIVGTGYIGLVTGLGLADFGNKVTCFDVDYEKIEKLKNGISPIKEKNIDELLKIDSSIEQLLNDSKKIALDKITQIYESAGAVCKEE